MPIRSVVVAGPTASGKTPLALELAIKLDGEIVNYDSVQLYRDFDIGSAKPGAEELARVKHHFIGEFDAAAPLTAGSYARLARARLAEIDARGKVPVLVGGTGFYLRALTTNLSAAPATPPELRARLRQRLEKRGPEAMHRLLARLEPAAAARIAPRDGSKLVRALEVRMVTGGGMEELWRADPPRRWAGLETLVLVLKPEKRALHGRIERRAEIMFGANGIVEETQRMLQKYPPRLRIFSAHGYKQACDILRGADRSAALAEAQKEQRHYTKRQWTWFRREPGAHWLEGFGDEAAVQAEALALALAFLGKCTTTRATR